MLVVKTSTGNNRNQELLPGGSCTTTQTQIRNWDQESQNGSLDPRMPQKIQPVCTSLGCSLKMRLIITAPSCRVMLLTVGQAQGEVQQKLSHVLIYECDFAHTAVFVH